MNIAGRKRPREKTVINARNMTTEQNMLIFSQQDIINLSQRTELPLQVVILTARRSATHMYFQDVRLFSTKIKLFLAAGA